MSEILSKLQNLSSDILNAASRRRAIGVILKKKGFLRLSKGAWLGFRGNDVVSGLLLEGSASDVYISSFILPIFDELKFVSWSLGGRIVHCSTANSADLECENAINIYERDVLPVKSAGQLITYIDKNDIDGFYPLWVKYICYLRVNKFDKAIEYFNEDMKNSLQATTLKKYLDISQLVFSDNHKGVSDMLSGWEGVSREIFGNGHFP